VKKVYNKLVRDRIPEIIQASGKTAAVRIADEVEYKRLLQQKLMEEVNEYIKSSESEELADIIEVVAALGRIRGLSFADLEQLAEKKRKDRGGFVERIVLLSVDD